MVHLHFDPILTIRSGLVENYGVEQSLSLLDLTTQKTGCPRLNLPLAV
jgi:hypothetical protein